MESQVEPCSLTRNMTSNDILLNVLIMKTLASISSVVRAAIGTGISCYMFLVVFFNSNGGNSNSNKVKSDLALLGIQGFRAMVWVRV